MFDPSSSSAVQSSGDVSGSGTSADGAGAHVRVEGLKAIDGSVVVSDGYSFTAVSVPSAAQADAVWEIYERNAAALGVLAAARHIMDRGEFDEFMVNPDVVKFIASDGEGTPSGMALVTSDLESVEWISPQYFYNLYPDLAAENKLLYIVFVAVNYDSRGVGLFPKIMAMVARYASSVNGVTLFDVCQFNDEVVPVKEMGSRLYGPGVPNKISMLDTQRWYVADFTDGLSPTAF